MGVAVFLCAFVVYAWTASPVAGWLDSPEFVAAAASLGVPHSPGHPLQVMLGRAAQLLIPFGDAAFRVNLVSAAAGAVAVALVAKLTQRVVRFAVPELGRWPCAAIAFGAALVFGFSWAAWTQSLRAEVYALEAALVLGALSTLSRDGLAADPRALAVAGLLTGLALANHHFITVLCLAPAALALPWRRLRVRTVGIAAVFVGLGLLTFVYLPLRAAANPVVNWGDPRTLDRFIWTVSAQAFQKSLAPTGQESRLQEAAEVGGALMEQVTPVVALVAVAGAYWLARRRETRRLFVLIVGVVVGAAAGPALLGFDAENPDAYGYLLPAVAGLAALSGCGLAVAVAIISRSLPRCGGLLSGLAIMLGVWQFADQLPATSLRRGYAAERWAQELLDPLPPRAILVTSYFETAFQIWALQAVADARPDVVHIDRSFLTYPGFAESLRQRHPELRELIDAPLRVGVPTPIELLPRDRPVVFELSPTLDPALESQLVPEWPFARWVPSALSPDERAFSEARDLDRGRAAAAALLATVPAEQKSARRVLLWTAFLRASFYCRQGRHEAARHWLDMGKNLAPDDPALGDLARKCDLS